MQADGRFAILNNRLPSGEYLTDNVITDRQQRRREIYRKYLNPLPKHLADRTHLLTWVESANLPVTVETGERILGSQLLVIPVTFKRPPPDSKVTIPAGFISPGHDGPGKLTMESSAALMQTIRFQLPSSVLPMAIDRATLTIKIRTPGRQVSIFGRLDGNKHLIHEVNSPLDAIRVDITDSRFLKPDEQGGLRFDLTVGSTPKVAGDRTSRDLSWRIESLAMEVVGRTQSK